MDSVTNTIRAISDNRADLMREQRYADRHVESIDASKAIEQAVVSVAEYLTQYFNDYTGKTEVLNPTTSVSTPDIVHVVQSVRDLSETVKASQLDLSPIVEQLGRLESQLAAIPKDKVELPEQKEDVSVSNLGDIDFTSLENAVKGIKLEKTDLKPVLASLQAVVKAIGAIHLPETNLKVLDEPLKNIETAVKAIKIDVPKTDLSTLEKEAKKQSDTLNKLLKKPVGGSGGGSSSWPAVDASGITQPLTVVDGALQTNVFAPNANITTDLSTPGIIVETDGVRTLTTTITSTEITEIWS